MATRDVLIALDVGTSTVTSVAGSVADGRLEIVGVGIAEARGIRRGIVVHPEAAAASIKEALAELHLTTGLRVDRVHLALGGAHIAGLNSRGVIAVVSRTREIAETDVRRAIEAARSIQVPPGLEILHVVAQEFIVDDQDGVASPVGMIGTRLEVNLHIVTGRSSCIQNLVECVRRAGASVDQMLLDHLATGEAVLTEDERQLGVGLVDMGGGTVTLAIFDRGALCHSAVLPFGGARLTNDLAVALRMPVGEAEKIKRRYAYARSALVDPGEQIRVATIGGRASRQIPRRMLAEILEPRVEEILHRLWDEMRDAGFSESLAAGVVLTGGGAMLQGLTAMAAEIFDLPVRRGVPVASGALADLAGSTAFSTAVGLLMWRARERSGRAAIANERLHTGRPTEVAAAGLGSIGRVVGRLRGLLRSGR